MGANYNAPGSQYNKDEQFAKLSIDNAFDAEFSEAIAVDVDENRFLIFANCTSAADVQMIGNKEWKFTEQTIKFEVPKKTYKGYGDKEVAPNALHDAIRYAIDNEIGFCKPFKASLYGANSKLQAVIESGEHKGKKLEKEDILALIKDQSFDYTVIESLDKLKDLKMDAPKGFSKGGGFNPKKTLEMRMEFVEDCIKDGSKYRELAAMLGWDDDSVKAALSGLLEGLMK